MGKKDKMAKMCPEQLRWIYIMIIFWELQFVDTGSVLPSQLLYAVLDFLSLFFCCFFCLMMSSIKSVNEPASCYAVLFLLQKKDRGNRQDDGVVAGGYHLQHQDRGAGARHIKG